ncbi:MAG: hypothetical protein EU548_03330 [Promethearchaeota archaeon]|nr:MAG: hypothetical protein EU548_03330 [Candidatus Lokiarchaeota archaeon]
MYSLKSSFKFICVVGTLLSGLSLFFEWYTFQAFSWDGELVVFWEFYLFCGWITPFSPDAWFNAAYQPSSMQLPVAINIIYLGLMGLSLYGVIGINIEDSSNLKKAKKFSYINVSSLMLSGYYICVVPICFFVVNQLYYPYLTFTEPNFIVIEYSSAIGYWIQCISFGLMFPYNIYFAFTVSRFERAPEPLEAKLQKVLNNVQIPIDFHQVIAEERLKLEDSQAKVYSGRNENIFEQFLRWRGVP